MNLLAAVLLISICFSCDKSEPENILCYYFDQRQCDGDEWASLISENETWRERTDALKEYLENKDIDVKDIYIDPSFHEGVCAACYVCPEVHRFFVKIEEESKQAIEGLELLNLGEGDCTDLFK